MNLTKQTIILLENYIQFLGFKAQIHFELEGCYKIKQTINRKKTIEKNIINFSVINQQLEKLNIDGEIITEYWKNQWEYVSKFNGQSPLKEALNLTNAIINIPLIFAQYGITETLIQPVVWSGDQGKLAPGASHIFTNDTRAVHIPNAVQLNVSVLDEKNENIIIKNDFGEYLQQCFLQTSLDCCLLYLPEESAFERLTLRTRYGLAQELCSPVDISGGHQGSIALYKKIGKHNQKMGLEPLLYDVNNNVLLSTQNWQKTARIEHRLGASSFDYDAFVNVIFALLNVIDALEKYKTQQCRVSLISLPDSVALPTSLYGNNNDVGAISLFMKSTWFSERINMIQEQVKRYKIKKSLDFPLKLGDKVKQQILQKYHPNSVYL